MLNHNDRYLQLSLNIAYYRKLKGMSQLKLAEAANISRTHLSYLEAPNMEQAPSLETLFNIDDALRIEPAKLLEFRD